MTWFNGNHFLRGYQNKKGGKGLVPNIPTSQTWWSLTTSNELL